MTVFFFCYFGGADDKSMDQTAEEEKDSEKKEKLYRKFNQNELL